jgi:hypothetical protein
MKLATILHKFKPVYLLWLVVPLLLWWALKDIRWNDVWSAVARLGLWQIAALVAINVITLLSFSGRWWLILRVQGYRIPYLTLTAYRVASFGVSYFTPGPQFGGEPLQVYLLTRNHGLPGPAAIAATVLDKIMELLINFLFLALGIMLIGQWQLLPDLSSQYAIGAIVGLFMALAGLSWAGWMPVARFTRRLPERAARAVEESERQAAQFFREQPGALAGAILVSVVSWGFILGEYWLAMSFLGLDLTMPQLVTAVTINRIAFLAPLPGGLGALESSQVLAMTVLGLDPAFGVSQGLIIRARDVLVGLCGLWFGWQAARKRRTSDG